MGQNHEDIGVLRGAFRLAGELLLAGPLLQDSQGWGTAVAHTGDTVQQSVWAELWPNSLALRQLRQGTSLILPLADVKLVELRSAHRRTLRTPELCQLDINDARIGRRTAR